MRSEAYSRCRVVAAKGKGEMRTALAPLLLDVAALDPLEAATTD